MKSVIESIQTKLAAVAALKYIDEDWGQLDYYSPNFPVKWPCVLIDLPNDDFSDIGMDKTAVPQNRQMAEGLVSITVANMKLTNTSGRAPQLQKDQAWSIWDLIEDIHEQLQGFRPDAKCGKLIRRARRRVKRDDGVQEYTIIYSYSMNNV